MKKDEALKLALEALEVLGWQPTEEAMDYRDNAIDAIREALAEQPAQQQEPVAWVSGYYGGQCVVLPTNPARIFNSGTAFYTSPQPSKPWVGLTEQERNYLEDYCEMIIGKAAFEAIEAKLREKNNG